VKIGAALASIQRLCVEAASLIYYMEEHPAYLDRMDAIITSAENKPIEMVSSVIILTEVITYPLRLGRTNLVQEYRDILLYSGRFRVLPVTDVIAESAADLRARYHLRTPDALHIATAIESGCDAFLTNDLGIKRVNELQVLVLDDLELRPNLVTT
jgi:predicted nucleic acid-binding protein